jgi:hypothetical protein
LHADSAPALGGGVNKPMPAESIAQNPFTDRDEEA